jgi:hypothetical protein
LTHCYLSFRIGIWRSPSFRVPARFHRLPVRRNLPVSGSRCGV